MLSPALNSNPLEFVTPKIPKYTTPLLESIDFIVTDNDIALSESCVSDVPIIS
jgi:hypothetical protein